MVKATMQVLLSYTRPWSMRWMAILAVVMVGICSLTDRDQAMDTWPVVPGLGFAGIFGVIAADRLKEQFAHPRSRLTPHFAAPHLLAAAIVVLLVGTGPALFFQNWYRPPGSGLLPLTFVIMTLAAAFFIFKSTLLSLTMISLLFATMIPATSPTMMDFIRGHYPLISATAYVVGALLWIRIGRCLMTITEEDSTYAATPGFESRAGQPELLWMQQTSRQLAADWWIAKVGLLFRDRWTQAVLRTTRPTLRSRVCRLSVPTVQPLAPWVAVTMVSVYAAVLHQFFGLAAAYPMFAVVPGLAVFAPILLWMQRKPMLAREAILPLSRAELVNGWMLAVSAECLRFAAIAAIPMLVVPAIGVKSHWDQPLHPGYALIVLPGVVGLHMALSLWLLPGRSRIAFWIGQIACLQGGVVAVMVALHADLSVDLLAGATGTAIAFSLVIAWFARRRWLRMELGNLA